MLSAVTGHNVQAYAAQGFAIVEAGKDAEYGTNTEDRLEDHLGR